MPDRDVVLAKVAAIQKCLRRIKDVTGLDSDRLDEIDAQEIFILNLQRAVQSAIDLATHIVASEGLGIPDTIRGNFVLLERARVITKPLSKKMQSMVGFRNIAIFL
ncbi:MAG TPA: HepT-like ribonuclease domain-containing protein [Thermodesulfobacteriota bacterium]|nr:HepT-like ribonuclease domain-containing protein [Thermodesulfobacteriota bacterium]